MVSAPSLPTVGEIARRLQAPVHKIIYVIRSRNIAACGRAGIANVYSEADIAHIASELKRIESDKQGAFSA